MNNSLARDSSSGYAQNRNQIWNILSINLRSMTDRFLDFYRVFIPNWGSAKAGQSV